MRTWMKMGALLGLGLAVGCTDKGDDSGLDSDEPDGGEDSGDGGTDVEPEAPAASVTWGAASVDIAVSGGGGAWWFGLAEVGADCGEDCWTGEDCVYGFETGDGEVLAYCHDAGDAGTSLAYGGDPRALAAGTTVFQDASADGSVTYMLESDPEYGGDGSCWVWGADVSYYDGLLCGSL